MSATVAALLCPAALLAIAALTVVANRGLSANAARRIVYGGALVVCIAAFAIALVALLSSARTDGQVPSDLVLPLGLPWIGARFSLDGLSAVFLAIVGLGGAAASLYGLGYGRHEHEPFRVLPFYPAFLAGMMLVPLAADAFTFLVSWEFMSLASWALVLAHHRLPENRRAATVYIVMAVAGTFALLFAFALLAGSAGGFAFATMRTAPPDAVTAGVVLALALIGAGSKAGLVPLHVWLPLAHPAAPSHVSALMSGVMTKIAVYGFLRLVFDLAGPPAWWWGVPVLVVGGITAALGVLTALMQADIKRLLACSTIENIGLIFAGLGLALAFAANGFAAAAALALTAALFHAVNHALFKSALFFGAGAVLTATGTRELDRLGGLIHRMPATALAVLVACVAIAALPPLNGFASEWLLFQAILLSPELPQWGLKLAVPAVGALLALSVALAAACFVRFYGIAFLGRPRSEEAATAHEVDRFSLAAMLGLAGLCVAAGVLPGLVIDMLAPAAAGLVGAAMPPQGGLAWLSIVPIAESRSSYNGLLVLVFIAISALGTAFVVHRFTGSAVRRAPAWDCGFPNADPVTQYTASSFAQPIRRVFAGAIFTVRESVEMPPPGDLAPARFRLDLSDPIWERGYLGLAGLVGRAADFANRLQSLTIRQYLSLVFLSLVALLVVLAVWP